jgi:hypothetical protein
MIARLIDGCNQNRISKFDSPQGDNTRSIQRDHDETAMRVASIESSPESDEKTPPVALRWIATSPK